MDTRWRSAQLRPKIHPRPAAGNGRQRHLEKRQGRLLLGHSIPNVFFRTVTAYNILRQLGVPVGKRDFLGNP